MTVVIWGFRPVQRRSDGTNNHAGIQLTQIFVRSPPCWYGIVKNGEDMGTFRWASGSSGSFIRAGFSPTPHCGLMLGYASVLVLDERSAVLN